MESPGVTAEDGGLALPLFSEQSPPLSRKGPKQKGPCVLCNTIKSGSWRRHHLVDGTICNRCYCRTVRLVKQRQGTAGSAVASGARARSEPQAWDADLAAAGSEAAGALALRQLANEPALPAKRPKQAHPQHPAAAEDDAPMSLRPRRQHSGLAAYVVEHPAAFMQPGGHPGGSPWAAGQQQAGALATMARQQPEGARLPELGWARQGQHGGQMQGSSVAAGGESLLQHLLGAMLQRTSLDSPASQVAPQLAAAAAQPSVWGRPLSSEPGQGQSPAWHPHAAQPATQQPSLQQLLTEHPSLLALLGQQPMPGRHAGTNPLQLAQQVEGPLALLQQLQQLHSPSQQQQPTAQQPRPPAQPLAQQAQRAQHPSGFTPLHQQLPQRDLEAAAADADAAPAPLLPPPASEAGGEAQQAGQLLEELQEDCWAAAGDLQEATHSASLAWSRCQRQLGGAEAVLLAVLPAAALALPSGGCVLHPAGALLARVLLPIGGVAAAALEAGASFEADLAAAVSALSPGGLAPALRIVMYGTAGVLLECWDGLPAVAAGRLGTHPRARQPCWSDGDEWALVFPGSPEAEHSAALRLFKAVLRVPVQQLAALAAAEPAPACDAPGPAAGSGASLGQPALRQRLRQLQRRLQASQPSPAGAAQADLKLSASEAPHTEAPASVQPAAGGHAGTHPLHNRSGQAGGSDSSGSGSQQGGHGPAGSGQLLDGSGEPVASGSAGASEQGQPFVSGQGDQAGDACGPCSSASPTAGSGGAGEELQQQQHPGELQPKAEPEPQQQVGQEEEDDRQQQQRQRESAVLAQDQRGGPPRHSAPPASQLLGPLRSAFLGAAPSAPPLPAVPFEAAGASREVELLAAAAKALSTAPGPRADSGCGSHGGVAGSGVQAAAEAAAAGNLLSGLESLGPLSLGSLQGGPSSSAALGLASVPGLLDSLRSLLGSAGVGQAQPQ